LTHAIDFELLVTQLKELKAGNIIHQPVYCSLTQHTVTTHPRKVMMIIEGILILS
jgi:uridine kinase